MQTWQSFQKLSATLAPVPGGLHRPAARNASEGRGLHASVDTLFGLDSRVDTDTASHVLVLVQNFLHLCTVYGIDFALETMRIVRARVCPAAASGTSGLLVLTEGGTLVMELSPSVSITMLAEDGFLVPVDALQDASGRVGLDTLERLLMTLSARIEYEGMMALPVVSVGLAKVENAGMPNQVVDRIGPGLVIPIQGVHYTTEWRASYERDMAWVLGLWRGLTQGRGKLVFQPIVAPEDRKRVLYHEALLRLEQDAAEAPVPMRETRAAMERLGLTRMVDHGVIHAVLNRLYHNPSLHLGCNLSAQSFVMDAWWIGVFEFLGAHPSVASRLTIELTESSPLADVDTAAAFAKRLREFGCRVALDDLGAGFSGIELVRHLRPNVIKIDGCYVRDARRGQAGAATLQRLIGLCRSLAPHVVVEGIEDAGDLERVTSLERVWLQGYYVGKTSAEVEPLQFRWATGSVVP